MRIIDRQAFLQMPAGTIYAKADSLPSLDFGQVEIKGDTVAGVDWCVQRLIGDFVGDRDSGEWADSFEAMHKGEDRAVDLDIVCRDGLFDNDQLFAVFDKTDAEALLATIEAALQEGYP